jgi:hypothetical protein
MRALDRKLAAAGRRRTFWRSAALVATLVAPAAAVAQTYEFLAAPSKDINRVFRLEKTTGEVGACQYGIKPEAPMGVTLCYPAGEGAKGGQPGEYALVASRHESEGGVFRVDLRSGSMSICFVLDNNVVCTAPAK